MTLAIGLVHPGMMGAAFGTKLRQGGHRVSWASEGRSSATARRAEEAGLKDAGNLAALKEASEVIISICPPHGALQIARQFAGFPGLFIDANALSPASTRELGEVITSHGGRFADGAIVGGPDSPRLYVSGEQRDEVVALFQPVDIGVTVLDGGIGAASALKMAYSSWTKTSAGLLLGLRAYARAEQVEEALLAQLAESQPELVKRSLFAAHSAATKGWRFVGEMQEVGESFRAVGLPGGFHDAAAEIFRRSPHNESASTSEETLHAVLEALQPERG